MPVSRSDTARRRPPGARRADLLRLLSEYDDGLAVADLAPLAGLHPNTVRAHLEVLVRAGSVTRRTEERTVPGRPREIYRATGAADDDRNYQLLARMLAGRLAELTDDPVAQAIAAGRRWSSGEPVQTGVAATAPAPNGPARPVVPPDPGPGATGASATEPTAVAVAASGPQSTREQLAPVIRLLREYGFAPELSEDASTIELRHCPFRELATELPEIVCSAHLGLIQGALDRIGPEVKATRILPFVQPDLCRAHLTGAQGADAHLPATD